MPFNGPRPGGPGGPAGGPPGDVTAAPAPAVTDPYRLLNKLVLLLLVVPGAEGLSCGPVVCHNSSFNLTNSLKVFT